MTTIYHRNLKQLCSFAALLSSVLIFTFAALAVPLAEDFEGNFPPPGWTGVSEGGGNAAWIASIPVESQWGAGAYSPPADLAAGEAANSWLLTPALTPSAMYSTMTFYASVQGPAEIRGDTLEIRLSVHGVTPADFTRQIIALPLSVPGGIGEGFQLFSVDLSAFVDSTLVLAFIHRQHDAPGNPLVLDRVNGPDMQIPYPFPSLPSPPHGAAGVPVTAAVSWSNPVTANRVTLYMSRDSAAVVRRDSAARVLDGAPAAAFQPAANWVGERTYYWRVVVDDGLRETAGPLWRFTAAAGGLGGRYRVAPAGADFSSIAEAITALNAYGVARTTSLELPPTEHNTAVVIPPVPGAADSARVIFTSADTVQPATLRAAGGTDSSVVVLAGASWIEFDRIHFIADSSAVRHCISISSGGSHNRIRNAELRGPGAAVTGSSGIHVVGANTNVNEFSGLTIRAAQYGVYCWGDGQRPSSGNVVTDCIIDSVRCGINLKWQHAAAIARNAIRVNGGAVSEASGVYVGTTLPGDTVRIHDNRIHGVATSGAYAVGVRVRPDSAEAVVQIFNNFIYDFANTGSTQIRALFVSSGICDVIGNSIAVNNNAATGAAYAVYNGIVGTGGSLRLLNNIFVNHKSGVPAYNVFILSATARLESDYNIFYGTGSAYRLGRWNTDLPTLTAWQTATGGDRRSLEGDPGFVSATDLHLTSSVALAHQNGMTVGYILHDIDGETRTLPPDRGADEYVFAAPPADLAILEFTDLRPNYPEFADVPVKVIVQNRGSAAQFGVPVTLYHNDQAVDQKLIDLFPLQTQSVSFNWTTGPSPGTGRLLAWCALPGDAVPQNDSLAAAVTIVPPPLSGNYRIGADGDYPTFAAACADLTLRGISSGVRFKAAAGAYRERVVIEQIYGATPEHTVTFVPEAGPVTLISSTGPATLELAGARHVHIEAVGIIAEDPNVTGILISAGADSNEIKNCTITGSFLSAISAAGLRTSGGGNDGNRFLNLEIAGFYHGIRLSGTANWADQGNLVRQCIVRTSRIGIRTDYQRDGLLSGNVLNPGHDGAAGLVYGIFLGPQPDGRFVAADGNTVTGARGAAGGCGIYANTGGGTARITNNMLNGWALSGGGLYGILTGGGMARIFHNSLWMNDVASPGPVIAIADSGWTFVEAYNNAVAVSERQNSAWCLQHSGAELTANFNAYGDLTGGNPQFRVGRSGGLDYTTLAGWQAATGRDGQSVFGNPGFIDSLNLHVRPDQTLLSDRGLAVADAAQDFDDEPREQPPDIGADEYTFRQITRDIGLQWVSPTPQWFRGDSVQTFAVRIENFGAQRADSVSVKALYNGGGFDQVFATLDAGTADTFRFTWQTPEAELEAGSLRVQAAFPGDELPDNDSVSAAVTLAGTPLTGLYTVGGTGASFASPAQAVNHLMQRGVSASVTLRIRPGEYCESLVIPPVPGASAANRIVIRTGGGAPEPTMLSAASGDAVLKLDGARFVTVEELSIRAAGTCSTAVLLRGGAADNVLRNCIVRGADSAWNAAAGVHLHNGCANNVLDALTISGAFTGIALSGSTAVQGTNNVVRATQILHARTGIHVGRQIGCIIEGCDIVPGSGSTIAAPCYGIHVAALGAGGGVTINGNRIHGFTDNSGSVSNRAVGVYAAAANGGIVRITNNFIYGFAGSGSLIVNGMYLSAGTNIVQHNSLLLDAPAAAPEIAGIFMSTGANHRLENNIIVSRVAGAPSYGIVHAATSLISNGNDIYGTGPGFVTGRIGGVAYATFAAWQAAGYDAAGIAAEPGFIAANDLHIDPLLTVVDGRGIVLEGVPADIDGDERGAPPDIGADEYAAITSLPAPEGLTISVVDSSIVLHWRRVAAAAEYRIYSASAPDLPPAEFQYVGTAVDTVFTLPASGSSIRFFTVTAGLGAGLSSGNRTAPAAAFETSTLPQRSQLPLNRRVSSDQ